MWMLEEVGLSATSCQADVCLPSHAGEIEVKPSESTILILILILVQLPFRSFCFAVDIA
jgi:hypothetical protein